MIISSWAKGGFDYPSGNTNRLVELMMLDLAAAWAQGVNFPGSEVEIKVDKGE